MIILNKMHQLETIKTFINLYSHDIAGLEDGSKWKNRR